MKQALYIRCDASTQIGLGHLVRCTALAEMLKDNFEIIFFCKEVPESYKQEFKFSLTEISTEDEFFQHVSHQSLVVLDGYHFTSSYQKRIKDSGAILACIVDSPNQEFFADLVINHLPDSNPLDYQGQVYTHFAFGLDFVLLRPPFLLEAKNQRVISKIDTVVICFGGSDSLNLTKRTLNVVRSYHEFRKIILIVGPLYTYINELYAIIDGEPNIELNKNVRSEHLLQLLLQAQLAIVPASGILMESLAAGNRIISGIYIDNQKLAYEAFKKQGIFSDAGTFSDQEIKGAIESVFATDNSAHKFIDGCSNERLLKKFTQLMISKSLVLREANEEDLFATYRWAIDPRIRAFSFQQKEIMWEDHVAWFQSKLQNEKCIYFIAEIGKEIIGSVRFDIRNGEIIISYLLDIRFQSKGYGLIVLAKSFQSVYEMLASRGIRAHELVGYVMMNNYPSIKTFVNLGFKKIQQTGKLKFVKSMYGSSNKN